MRYLYKFILAFMMASIFLQFCLNPARGLCSDSERRVLVVHSYHLQYEWVSTIARGIKREYEKMDNVQVESFFMDTKRQTSNEWKEEAGRVARSVIEKWDPDIVITTDDNAQEFVGSYYAGKVRPYVIFCGVNAEAEKYGYPAGNVTGILERPHIVESIDLLERIMPDLKKIAILSDNSPTSSGAVKFMKSRAGSIKQEIIAYDMPATFSEWKKKVHDYQHTADAILIYMYHTVKRKGHDRSIAPKKVMDWTVRHSSIPVVGFFTFTVDDGALLGVVESGLEHGRDAARIAIGIMNGRSITEYPITTAKEGIVMFNMYTARNLGISVSSKLRDDFDIVIGD